MATFGVLGPISVVGDDGADVTLTGLRQRRLLSALLLHRGRVVSMDRLSELVWDTDALVDAAALQSLVFRLRQRVGLIELEYRAPGYILRVPNERLDAARFESLVLEAIAQRADPRRSVELLDGALELWRGDPFDDLVDSSDGQVEIDRLNELRCRALEERFELRLELGHAGIELADLEAFAAREPLRERPRHLLIGAYESLGRRADGLRVYDSYRRLLADELGVAPSPALRQRHDDLLAEDDITVQPQAGSQHHRAPATIRKPASSFIGREDLLTRTAGLLSDARLITLVGPGGVGKTRLATELVHQVDLAQIDSTIFCDLTSATDRTVTEVVMAAAAIESRADQNDLDRLVDVLRHERCCVVLDNCEHVLEQAAIVAELLVEMTDHVVVLATSRERLAVDGERLVSVPPLPLAGGTDSPATRLLADRMIAVTGKPPDDDDLVSLDELARRLDGLPLALELAAARLQSLSAQEVLAGVERSIAVLRGGRRTVERHRSVDAALRWSYDLLDAATKATLRAAATFSAPFDPMDVASVMEVEHADAVDGLSALIERSMAQRDNDRFFLLHVVRRFAEECTAADERGLLEARLAVRMRSVAEALRADLRTTRSSTPIDRYLSRLADFRRAIEISLDVEDVDTALHIVVSLRDLALNSSSFELAQWAEDAATAGARAGHPLTVDGYAIAGLGAWKQGSLDDTRRLLSLAEAIVERSDSSATYELLGAQATEDLADGELFRAIERLDEAVKVPGVMDDPLHRAETLGTMAICMAYAHDPDGIAVADSIAAGLAGHAAGIAEAWNAYAAGECRLDTDPTVAHQRLQHAVDLARTGGSTFLEGIAGASLASLEVRSDNRLAAVDTYRWLVPLWLRAGLQSPFWTGMRSVVELLTGAGEVVAAVRILGAVMAPGSGHDVYGDDAARLATIRSTLEQQVGTTVFDDEFRRGSEFDEAAAAYEATAAFDRQS